MHREFPRTFYTTVGTVRITPNPFQSFWNGSLYDYNNSMSQMTFGRKDNFVNAFNDRTQPLLEFRIVFGQGFCFSPKPLEPRCGLLPAAVLVC